MESDFDTWFDSLPSKKQRSLLSPKIDLQICFNAGAEIAKSKCDLCKAKTQLLAVSTIFFMGNTSRDEALRELGLVDEKYAKLAEEEDLTLIARSIRGEKP